MDRLASIGRTSAESRVSNLLLELRERLTPIGQVRGETFHFPLTQEQVGDVLGLTAVHVNRTLRLMDEEQLIRRDGTRWTLLNVQELQRLAKRPERVLRTDLS